MPKPPARRLSPEEAKAKYKKDLPLKIFRRLTTFLILLAGSVALLYFATPLLTTQGKFWQDNVLWRSAFIAACGPLTACLGFVGAGAYYMIKHYRHQKQKRERKRAKERAEHLQKSEGDGKNSRPDSEATLVSRNQRLEPLKEVVVEPATQAPRKRGWAEWLSDLSMRLKGGYDGRGQRKRAWDAEQNGIEMGARRARGQLREGDDGLGISVVEGGDEGAREFNRPVTEWPVFE